MMLYINTYPFTNKTQKEHLMSHKYVKAFTIKKHNNNYYDKINEQYLKKNKKQKQTWHKVHENFTDR